MQVPIEQTLIPKRKKNEIVVLVWGNAQAAKHLIVYKRPEVSSDLLKTIMGFEAGARLSIEDF